MPRLPRSCILERRSGKHESGVRRDDRTLRFRHGSAAGLGLNRAYQQRDGGLTDTKVDPLLASLRGDPRYTALLRKLNLPE